MPHTSRTTTSLFASLALASAAATQQAIVTTDATTDAVIALSPFDGSLLNASLFGIPNTVQVSAIMVNDQVWVSEQTADRIVRYDVCGNVLGTMGPTLAGGGLDNIRGMNFFGGIVYVTNDGTNNGATANSLVTFDPAGNYLTTLPLAFSPSPFAVIPWQGDLLVVSSSANDDVHRYTLTGTSVGTFHNSASIGFGHQAIVASDGNVWCSTFTSDTIVKLDATTGAVIQSIPTDNARGVYELLNGNIVWTNTNGIWIHDIGTGSSTLAHPGSCYHLNLIQTDFACHKRYGDGCHSFVVDQSNHFELFPDVPSAKATLDGNALQFNLTPTGYAASWVPGVANALFVPPSASATIVADASFGTEAFTPSAPIPVLGGTAATWTVSSEGVLTAGTPGNQGTSSVASLSATAAAQELAWYTWVNQNPTEAGSGKIKWEEVGGVLYVTFDGVELGSGTPTVAPSTYQFQVNMTTGDVFIVWTSFSASNSTSDVLVGCTLAGTGETPVSIPLTTTVAFLEPDAVLSPLTLTASPSPVINPNTTVTFTASNVPELFPGAGIYAGTMFFSLNPLPGGLDLAGILTTLPGCNAYLSSLDLPLAGVVNNTSTLTWTLDFSNTVFQPGFVIASQAIALFDGAAPLLNGEDGGLLFSNGLLSTTYAQ